MQWFQKHLKLLANIVGTVCSRLMQYLNKKNYKTEVYNDKFVTACKTTLKASVLGIYQT